MSWISIITYDVKYRMGASASALGEDGTVNSNQWAVGSNERIRTLNGADGIVMP
jgi:hypothetical protein